MGRRQQSGIALIIVLMIVALVSVLATEMGSRLQLQLKRAANIKDSNQAYWYAMGAEQFARQSLEQLLKDNKETIHLNQPWAEEFNFPLEGGGIQAKIEDMQSCFNLNALRDEGGATTSPNRTNTNKSNPGNKNINQVRQTTTGNPSSFTTKQAFKRLLQNAEFEISSYSADTLADSLQDWLDSDDSMQPFGAEDSEYESYNPPYLTANNLMTNKSELRLVKGVEGEWFGKLLPLVCVLPQSNELKININTLNEQKAAVLAGLTGLSLQDAKSRIAGIPQNGYKKVGDFFAESEIQALNLSNEQKKWFSVRTAHFILYTKTRYNKATFKMASVLKVDDNNRISVVRREFGGAI